MCSKLHFSIPFYPHTILISRLNCLPKNFHTETCHWYLFNAQNRQHGAFTEKYLLQSIISQFQTFSSPSNLNKHTSQDGSVKCIVNVNFLFLGQLNLFSCIASTLTTEKFYSEKIGTTHRGPLTQQSSELLPDPSQSLNQQCASQNGTPVVIKEFEMISLALQQQQGVTVT